MFVKIDVDGVLIVFLRKIYNGTCLSTLAAAFDNQRFAVVFCFPLLKRFFYLPSVHNYTFRGEFFEIVTLFGASFCCKYTLFGASFQILYSKIVRIISLKQNNPHDIIHIPCGLFLKISQPLISPRWFQSPIVRLWAGILQRRHCGRGRRWGNTRRRLCS